ncbi:MAG: cytochrome P450 [Acidimicrobiales bacterium]
MSTEVLPSGSDVADADLFSDETLDDPYPLYRAIRDAGPVVHSNRHHLWMVSRHADVRDVLKDWRSYSSAGGTAVEDSVNELRAGNIISTDPPDHDHLRDVLSTQMSAREIRKLQSGVEERAHAMVAALVRNGGGDVVTGLAQPLPLGVVADLVGFPDEGREGLLEWVDASFNTFGPLNARARSSVPKLEGIWSWLSTMATRERLRPGGLGAAIHDAKDRGDITPEQCQSLLFAYATAGIDTTVNAVSSAVWLLARHPEQWEVLRSDPGLVPGALNEVLRLESPIQAFTRRTTAPREIGGVAVPPGARVLVLFGSANRDERRWEEPEQFDVRRKAVDQVAFGYGVHSCAGQFLARVEGHAVLSALVAQVRRLRLVTAERKLNNVLRGFASVQVEMA